MPLSRRDLLRHALLGSGLLGLRSLASGLPTWFLANPLQSASRIKARLEAQRGAQYLILNTSSNGDPLNCNVPGTYNDPGIAHPLDPLMAPTPITLGGATHTAAKPWSTLTPDVLARTSFIHHSTLTNNHSNHPKVMELMGAVRNEEMLVSVIAGNLASSLGTVQDAPMNLSGTETLQYKGRLLPLLTPPALRALFISPTGPLTDLQKLRDADLDRIHDIFKRDGNAAQRAFVDSYAQSQVQARSLSQDIMQRLSSLTTNTPLTQVTAAVLMVQMKIAPVLSIRVPFGGDNHNDADLAGETTQHINAIATLQALMDQLAAAKLQDDVTVANLNVFGRTMSFANRGVTGRDHLANHHCTVLIGKNIRSSVIGGVVANGKADYTALDIDSTSGEGRSGADIGVMDSLASVGKTLSVALGVDPSVVEDRIPGGKVIPAALS